jgi:hypothetical protein
MQTDKIALDADGVLMDFVTAAYSYTAEKLVPGEHCSPKTIEWFYQDYPRGSYDMHAALGLSKQACWDLLDTVAFWKTVQPYSGAHEFVNQVLRLATRKFASVFLVTKTTRNPVTAGAKAEGLAQFGLPVYVVWAGDKSPFDDGRTLLIDDCEENCNDWCGPVIEFPQLWNPRHSVVQDPLSPRYDVVLSEIRKELKL